MPNRRNFLKGAAIIAVGGMVLPAKVMAHNDNKCDKSADVRYWWIRAAGYFPNPKFKKGPAFLYRVSKLPEFKVGSQFIIPNDVKKTQAMFEYIMSGMDCNYDPEKYVLGKL